MEEKTYMEKLDDHHLIIILQACLDVRCCEKIKWAALNEIERRVGNE